MARGEVDATLQPRWWTTTRARWVLLLAIATSTLCLIMVAHRHDWLAVLLVVVSTAACATLAVAEQRRPLLRPVAIVSVIVVVCGISVYRPPRSSADLYSYAMYGRIVSVHHANPYEVLPIDYPSDPIFWKVSPIWVRRGSVFGPAYVAFAASGMAITGDSGFTIRLFFQITTALAGGAVLWLIWRRTRSTSALILLGLHPVFAVTINDGHNDLFIGLAILGAALLLARNRGWTAGFVIGIASLVKLTTLLGLVGAVLWAVRRNERRLAARVVAATGAVLLVGYLPFIGSAAHVLAGADKTVTPASPWNPLAAALLGNNAGRDLADPLAPNTTLIAIFWASMVLVAGLALFVGWRSSREQRPASAMGMVTASYVFGAEYTQPWYSLWALPVLLAGRRSALTWVVWIHAALVLAVWRMPLHPRATVFDTIVRGTISYAAPLGFLVAFAVVALRVISKPEHDDGQLDGPIPVRAEPSPVA